MGANVIRCVDKPGLILKSKKDELTPAQQGFARDDDDWQNKDHKDLRSIVKEVKPHVLIGTSTVAGSFTEEVVKEMAKHVERPVIFPLSNPTKLHEAKPQDLYDWTDGKVLVATGSPFPKVKYDGKEFEVCKYPSKPILTLLPPLFRVALWNPECLNCIVQSILGLPLEVLESPKQVVAKVVRFKKLHSGLTWPGIIAKHLGLCPEIIVNVRACRYITDKHPAECNNSVTFPGIGLGAILSHTRLLSPPLIVAAVKALAASAPVVEGKGSGLLPDVTEVREISVRIAKAVINAAIDEDLAQEKDIPTDDKDLEEWIREQMWDARYRPLKLVEEKEATAHARGEAGISSHRRTANFEAGSIEDIS